MGELSKKIRDKVLYLQARRSSEYFIRYLRRLGIKIGEGTMFEDFMKTAPLYESFEEFLVESGIPRFVVYGDEE